MVSTVVGGRAPAHRSISESELAALRENPSVSRTRSEAPVRASRASRTNSQASNSWPGLKYFFTSEDGEKQGWKLPSGSSAMNVVSDMGAYGFWFVKRGAVTSSGLACPYPVYQKPCQFSYGLLGRQSKDRRIDPFGPHPPFWDFGQPHWQFAALPLRRQVLYRRFLPCHSEAKSWRLNV